MGGGLGGLGTVRKCAKDKHESKKAEKLLWHAKKETSLATLLSALDRVATLFN